MNFGWHRRKSHSFENHTSLYGLPKMKIGPQLSITWFILKPILMPRKPVFIFASELFLESILERKNDLLNCLKLIKNM